MLIATDAALVLDSLETDYLMKTLRWLPERKKFMCFVVLFSGTEHLLMIQRVYQVYVRVDYSFIWST